MSIEQFINGVPSFQENISFMNMNTKYGNYRSNQMNIIGKPSASYEQCERWLKNKTDNPLALQCLPLLWRAAVENGINPVILISQAMIETGFFKFGGVIDSSYHNTCGLKTSKGGGDYAASAHMRFKSWEEGIKAHADHLGLYAGSPNCPKYSPECASHKNIEYKANGTTKDPRHFPYLHGKYKTVQSLTGTWATDPQYDKKLIKFINEIENTEIDQETSVVQKQQVTAKKGMFNKLSESFIDSTKPFFKRRK